MESTSECRGRGRWLSVMLNRLYECRRWAPADDRCLVAWIRFLVANFVTGFLLSVQDSFHGHRPAVNDWRGGGHAEKSTVIVLDSDFKPLAWCP
jgi:hypothetical protein